MGQRLVINVDQFQRILGDGAVGGDDADGSAADARGFLGVRPRARGTGGAAGENHPGVDVVRYGDEPRTETVSETETKSETKAETETETERKR